MAQMKGKITKVRKDRKGICLKIDGDDVWFSGYKPSYIGEAQSGDEVSFQYTEKGDWKNITEDTLKIEEKAPPKSSGGGGGGYKGGSSKGEFRSVPQLVRTDSVNQAIALIETQGSVFASPKAAAKAALYIANVFEAYVNGEISLDGVDCPAVVGAPAAAAATTKGQVQHTARTVADPEPPAEKEPEPEPEPESPAPSLDSFLGDD